MNDPESFFVSEAIRHARTLPIGDCTDFLAGMHKVIGPNHPAHTLLASVLATLNASDAQLELIATGQLKLNLEIAA